MERQDEELGAEKWDWVWRAARVGVPRVRGGSRWVSDCWPKGSDQFLHEPMATRALERTLEVGKDQEVGRNGSAKQKDVEEDEWE